jgi:hypothetical protein
VTQQIGVFGIFPFMGVVWYFCAAATTFAVIVYHTPRQFITSAQARALFASIGMGLITLFWWVGWMYLFRAATSSGTQNLLLAAFHGSQFVGRMVLGFALRPRGMFSIQVMAPSLFVNTVAQTFAFMVCALPHLQVCRFFVVH